MKQEPRFVTFNLDGYNHVDQMVGKLLSKTITCMNQEALTASSKYSKLSGSEVEQLSYKSLTKVAPSIGFPVERIDLISGHIFPDILLHGTRYGVEIKSTQKDVWTSTGSSIVESTRDSDTDRIYMLFGKLGGVPEFRCKPYQMCLSNIAVTHSPRYLIDMNLEVDKNIFVKMDTDYEVFRQYDEGKKISCVRQYYLKKAKMEKKYEMPWWMGETTNVNLSFYNDLPMSEKNILQAKACILFKSLYEKDARSRYRPVALWLCNYYSLLCPNMRDDFSAGGQFNFINGKKLLSPYPHIVQVLLEEHSLIKRLLDEPTDDILQGIQDFWDFEYDESRLYLSWLNMVEKCFQDNPKLSSIPIVSLMISGAKLS
ncbi:hypothetical protein [Prevotella denticola]|uniref:hypothetical protein n=1 Tax=Prevotella denticola TaxID=28129 RepID=UPI00068BEF02|nr:hypothetical protein [Prevotella denticola]